ncbi:DUF6221 family protein [Micromonospora sp. NPDC048986]|uniref:DUF6221 family protein n=1 Tax=Micromonospora sp. NPDC048986 TaxID=3155644 RepID=UPI0034110048
METPDIAADLITWLRAQLDEDERLAKAVPMVRWHHDVIPDRSGPDHVLLIGDRVVSAGYAEDDPLRPEEVGHIVRHQPSRALAEVDSKRRILAMVQRWLDAGYPTMDAALWLLALPYADRPGYRDEWRP